jgi:hypothetical protein
MDRINPTNTPPRGDGEPMAASYAPSVTGLAAQKEAVVLLKKAKEDILSKGQSLLVAYEDSQDASTGARVLLDLPESGSSEKRDFAGLLPKDQLQDLDENTEKHRLLSQGEKDEREVPLEGEENLGNAILQSLARESTPTHKNASIEASGLPREMDLDKMEALIAKVANRVLVTDPKFGQNPEVRVQVAPDLMPGTGVRLWKGDGGRLHVEFDTTSTQWAKILSESIPVLADRLGARIHPHEAPEVTVRYSRDDMPEDGRSRQGGSQHQHQHQQHEQHQPGDSTDAD